MEQITVTRGAYPTFFGGIGFHNNDATMYHVMEPEHFRQYVAKCYREISPGFMRTFAGFSDWTKDAMDEFAEYYAQMQKITDTPMYLTPALGKYMFSDEEIDAYAEAVAQRLSYLYFDKNVRHIRYYCFSNELSCGDYGILNNDLPFFKKYHVALYRAFARHQLPIGLLSTDATGYNNWKSIEWAIANIGPISEDYCVHIYERAHNIYDESFYDFFYEKCREISAVALRGGKRLILGEIGIQNNSNQLSFENGVVVDTCRYFTMEPENRDCALMLTEMSFAALNAGVFATAYWSYIDHPAPFSCHYSNDGGYAQKWSEGEPFFSGTARYKYNQWGMLKWGEGGDYSPRPHYWCLGLLAKLFRKNSYVMDVGCSDPLLRCASIRNTDGSVTLGIVNRHRNGAEIRVSSDLFRKPIRVYEYDPANVPENPFGDLQSPSAVLSPDSPVYTLKPFSVTFFTTDYVEKDVPVEAEGLRIEDSVLFWEPVADPEHCYYRVFASENSDLSSPRQIASTVACSLPIQDPALHYLVLSVDRSGNI